MRSAAPEIGTCHGPGCRSVDLIDAHIVPRGFARIMHGKNGYNLGITEKGAQRAKLQHGRFDRNILCADCDRKLGELDEFALTFCTSDLPRAQEGTIGSIANVDCDRLAAFAISLVWRASISRLAAFDDIDLGPVANRARDASFGEREKAFRVIMNRLVSPRYDVLQFYVEPVRWRMSGLNIYSFQLGGFQWFVLADGRAVPSHLRPLLINGLDTLPSLAIPFEETIEFKGMQAVADRQRRL